MEFSQLKALKSVDLTIPSFYGTLKNFQRTGVMAAFTHLRLIIGDMVGMGKTVESVALLCLLYDQDQLPLNSALVICQGTQREDWEKEFKKFCPLKAKIGYSEDRKCNYLKTKNNVLILSYDTVSARLEELSKINWSVIIVDEPSAIKNHLTKRWAAVKTLTDKSFRVILLNATSIEKSLGDGYSSGELLETGFWGSYQNFLDTYCNVKIKRFKTKYNTWITEQSIIGIKSIESLQQLQKKFSKYYFRRTYAEVGLEMPSKTPKIIPVILKDCQKKEYLEQLEAFKPLKKGDPPRKIPRPRPAQFLYNLLKICDGKLVDWKLVDKPETVSAKGEALSELIDKLEEPFIIYSTYLDQLLAAAKIVKAKGLKIGFFTGHNRDTRQQHSDEFVEGKRDCLLITGSGSRGKNWPNSRHMIFLNQVYNPELREQIEGRITRLTSGFPNVFIWHLITKDTIEENVLLLQKHRKEIASLVNEEGDIADLTEEQIDFLLNGRKSLLNKDELELTEELFKEDLTEK
jgi:SNF2 family DNA or RNA helicase